jgi:hypothetical protein
MVAVSQRFFTYEERPELRGRAGFLRAAWPAFMLESPISNERWHLLYERFGRHQFWLVDESSDEILAEGNSVPVRLDVADLPDRGWEYVMERGGGADARLRDSGARRPDAPRRRHQRPHARRDAPPRG